MHSDAMDLTLNPSVPGSMPEPGTGDGEEISRPGTAMSISEQAGMGEDTMVSFIRSCMTSILRPFGETVDELQRYVATLSESVSSVANDTESHAATLAQQAALISDLRKDLDRTANEVLQTQSLLDVSIKEKASLENRLEDICPRVGQLEEQAAAVSDAVKELQPRVKETRLKLARCEESKFETDRDIAHLRTCLENTRAEFELWEKTHEILVQTVNSNKVDFDHRLQEFQVVHRDLQEQRKSAEDFRTQLENRLRNMEGKAHEADKTLKEHAEKHQTSSTSTVQLQARTETLEKGYEDVKERINSCEVEITDNRVTATQNRENLSKLMKIVSSPDVLTNLEVGVAELTRGMEGNLQSIESLKGRCDELTAAEDQVRVLAEKQNESIEILQKQAGRVETILGLDPIQKEEDGESSPASPDSPGMVLKGGILLTDQQINTFREIFDEFDADSSGTISITELDAVMQRTGLEPPMDIVYAILESIDMDKSGDIDFDEFCSLLTRMLGTDGKVDKEKMLQSMYDSMSYDAKTRKAVETVIHHETELQEHKEMIVSDQSRISDANVRIETLQENLETLNAEVKKLRQGLDLNQEYWKGFSRGLKETKRTVTAESEEGMPSVQKLRSTLPPLPSSGRPSTALPSAYSSGYSTLPGSL